MKYSPSRAATGTVAGLAKHAAARAAPAKPGRPAVNAQSATAKPSTAGVWVQIARLAVDQTDVASPYAIAARRAMRARSRCERSVLMAPCNSTSSRLDARKIITADRAAIMDAASLENRLPTSSGSRGISIHTGSVYTGSVSSGPSGNYYRRNDHGHT